MAHQKRYEYQDRVICFMDVLGFSELITLSSKDSSLIERIGTLLNEVREGTKGRVETTGIIKPKIEFEAEVVQFSDCIVFSALAAHPFAALWLINSVTHFASEILWAGYPVRGGATVGKVYHEDNLVFGPAMVEAHELESKKAKVPRIIISKELDRYLVGLDMEKTCRDFISQGKDFDFIDYIKWNHATANGFEHAVEFMQALYELTISGLNHHDLSVVGKYEWLRREYNTYILSRRKKMKNNLSYVPNSVPYTTYMELSEWALIP